MAHTAQPPSFTPQQRARESGRHPLGPAGTAGAQLVVKGPHTNKLAESQNARC
jgi:hypothetical protein